MDPAHWKKIDQLFDEALGLPEGGREEFVSRHDAYSESVKQAVLELLRAERESETFLGRSAMDLAAQQIAIDTSAPPIPAPTFLDGQLAGYKIVRLIGAGGMGEVYLARDDRLERNVALKILPSEYGSEDERVRRFEREAKAISSLNHPGIVTIHDIGTADGTNYIATEFVEGKTLRQMASKRPDIRTVLSIAVQVVDALCAAHRNGIVHRDIKPENVMVRDDGYAKVLDFGLAKLTGSSPEGEPDVAATKKGVIIGTPAYMSPSQIGGEKIDGRTDLWSFGVVLYELLTGTNPFKGEDRKATFRAILTKEPERASTLNRDVPPELDGMLQKLLEKDPALGYQTADDLGADLKRIKREMDSSSSISGSSQGVFVSGIESVRRYPWRFLIAAAVVIAAGTALYFLFPRSPVPTAWSNANNVQLTFERGTEVYPSISPDGKSFVYASDKDGDFDIYLVRIGGGNEVNLTKDSPGEDTMPAFSPDGDRIAFRSDRAGGGIFVMGATGENPKRILDFGFEPSWSPDGKQIVVGTRFESVPSVRTPSALWIADVADGKKRKLYDNFALQPKWSPEGSRIAFWYTENRGKRIVATIPVSGGDPVDFAFESNTNWNPAWSPDGEYLYYASDRAGDMGFWRAPINMQTGKPAGEHERIPTPARFNRHLGFSKDGKRMVYVQTSASSNIAVAPLDGSSEKIDGKPRWITKGDFELSYPQMTPDGKYFVARLIRDTQDDIVLVDTRDGSIRDLTNDKAFDRYARLSPDGKRIAFSSDRGGVYQVWLMNIDGSGLKQFTNSPSIASIPAWSPDGSRLSFDSSDEVFIADVRYFDATGKLRFGPQIPKPAGNGFFRIWDWSPDGKKLAGTFSFQDGHGVGVYSFETGEYTRLTDFTSIPAWLPDSKRLIFVDHGRPVIADAVTKEQREVFPEIGGDFRNVMVSRDGRSLYYTIRESESNIWLLDLSEAE